MQTEKTIQILKEYYKNNETSLQIQRTTKKDPFRTLIKTVLSQRTRDENTLIAANKLFKVADTPEKIIKLDNKKLQSLIKKSGFYKVKARRIKEICKKLIKEYNGKVPKNIEELLKFKGVGKKTASITIVYGHNMPNFIPVDIHVHIIANRLGWIKTKIPEKTMEELMKIVPKKYWYDINDLFVRHGQNTCLTRSPKCSICPIKQYCKRINITKSR